MSIGDYYYDNYLKFQVAYTVSTLCWYYVMYPPSYQVIDVLFYLIQFTHVLCRIGYFLLGRVHIDTCENKNNAKKQVMKNSFMIESVFVIMSIHYLYVESEKYAASVFVVDFLLSCYFLGLAQFFLLIEPLENAKSKLNK